MRSQVVGVCGGILVWLVVLWKVPKSSLPTIYYAVEQTSNFFTWWDPAGYYD